MQAAVLAKCFSSKNLFNGTKSAEFTHTYQHHDEEVLATEDYSDSFTLITVNNDFEAVWKIEISYRVLWRENDADPNHRLSFPGVYGCWNKIKLQNSNKIISGNFAIQVKEYSTERSTFDMNASSFEKNIFTTNINVDASMTITFEIFYENLITEDYGKFLENMNTADVTFFVGDLKFSAQKRVMASRSVIFSIMFDAEMQEKKTGQVVIQDIEPDTFKLLLDFIYSGKVDSNNTDDLLKLMVIADKYLMSDLVILAGLRISNKLSTDNVVDILITAHLVKLEFLKDDCWNLIANNKNLVLDTQAYQMLKESHPDLLSEFWLFDNEIL